ENRRDRQNDGHDRAADEAFGDAHDPFQTGGSSTTPPTRFRIPQSDSASGQRRRRRTGGRAIGLRDLYRAAGHDHHLVGDDDALAGMHAAIDDDQIALALAGSDGADFGGVIAFNDVHKGTLLANLLGADRDQDSGL